MQTQNIQLRYLPIHVIRMYYYVENKVVKNLQKRKAEFLRIKDQTESPNSDIKTCL